MSNVFLGEQAYLLFDSSILRSKTAKDEKEQHRAETTINDRSVSSRRCAYDSNQIVTHLESEIYSKEIGFPLAQTSANISGQPAITKIQEVIDCFANKEQKPDLVINAGDLPKAQPSTVVDLTNQEPKILRQGEVKIA